MQPEVMLMQINLEQARRKLKSTPLLLEVLNDCVLFAENHKLAVGACGSFVKGQMDEWSDLDLLFISLESSLFETDIKSKFLEYFRRKVNILDHFPATHLGKSQLLVIYFELNGSFSKVDIEFVNVKDQNMELPAKCEMLFNPMGLAFSQPSPSEKLNFDLLYRKFACWLLFSYQKMARGEYMQAMRSIDFSREHVLLPFIRDRLKLPQDSHRRLEQSLPKDLVEKLYKTHPAQLGYDDIWNCLKCSYEIMASELQLKKRFELLEKDSLFSRMWNYVNKLHSQRSQSEN